MGKPSVCTACAQAFIRVEGLTRHLRTCLPTRRRVQQLRKLRILQTAYYDEDDRGPDADILMEDLNYEQPSVEDAPGEDNGVTIAGLDHLDSEHESSNDSDGPDSDEEPMGGDEIEGTLPALPQVMPTQPYEPEQVEQDQDGPQAPTNASEESVYNRPGRLSTASSTRACKRIYTPADLRAGARIRP